MSVAAPKPAPRSRTQRSVIWGATLVVGISIFLVIAAQSFSRQDLEERPLQVGEAVTVKNTGKGSRPGFVRSISTQGQYEIAMGATREIAARPQTDVLKLEGTGRLKRRKEDSP